MVVADVMTEKPARADAADTVRSVLATLLEMDIRHLPVVNEGELVGIVSDRDLRSVQASSLQGNDEAAQDLLELPISAVMCGNVISVDPETDLSEVVSLMLEHRVGAIPVVSADTSALVGIVSYVDVLRAASTVLE
jgi:CBS domain-containing protein